MFSNELQQSLLEALPDDAAREVREQVGRALSAALKEAGSVLWVGGWMLGGDRSDGRSPYGFGNDAVVGLATIVQIAGELCSGIVLLLDEGNAYSAAALLRQMVETEYLAWAFTEEKTEAAVWMRASRDDRVRMWQPRHIRDRSEGRFRTADYHRHCETGGHPTPDARRLLPDHHDLPIVLLWLELAYHGVSTWQYFEKAANDFGYGDQLATASKIRDLRTTINEWQQKDRLRMLKEYVREHGTGDRG